MLEQAPPPPQHGESTETLSDRLKTIFKRGDYGARADVTRKLSGNGQSKMLSVMYNDRGLGDDDLANLLDVMEAKDLLQENDKDDLTLLNGACDKQYIARKVSSKLIAPTPTPLSSPMGEAHSDDMGLEVVKAPDTEVEQAARLTRLEERREEMRADPRNIPTKSKDMFIGGAVGKEKASFAERLETMRRDPDARESDKTNQMFF